MKQSWVVIGGGTGSYTVLSGLRAHPIELNSIVTMMDSGGNSGVLRDAYGILPPGDLRRCLSALSAESEILRDLFSFRFRDPPLSGHSFGNLFLLALTQILGSEQRAVEAIGRILKIEGSVLPVTWDNAHLNAELEDGQVIRGEGNIDVRGQELPLLPDHDQSLAIRRVFLEPEARANPLAVERIASCDAVVLAPGDIFTSTIANLLVKGIPEALQATKAPLIYVVNLMTKHGESDGYTAARHVEEIVRYLGRIPDAVLIHEGDIPLELRSRYESEQANPVEVDCRRIHELGVRTVWCLDIMSADSLVRHDPSRTANALVKLVEKLGRQDSDSPLPHKGAVAGARPR